MHKGRPVYDPETGKKHIPTDYWVNQITEDEQSDRNGNPESFMPAYVPILKEASVQLPQRPVEIVERSIGELREIVALSPCEHLVAVICNALSLYLYERRMRAYEDELAEIREDCHV